MFYRQFQLMHHDINLIHLYAIKMAFLGVIPVDKEQLCGVLLERGFHFEVFTELEKSLLSSTVVTEIRSEIVSLWEHWALCGDWATLELFTFYY